MRLKEGWVLDLVFFSIGIIFIGFSLEAVFSSIFLNWFCLISGILVLISTIEISDGLVKFGWYNYGFRQTIKGFKQGIYEES